MCLHFRMQKEDILEHTNVTCHLCNIGMYLIKLLNILKSHAKILVSALEWQVLWQITNDEVVDH